MQNEANETIQVIAAVIVRDNRYLVCQRPAHKRHPGLWEFPGGKLEPGETLPDAAKRELSEELAIKVTRMGKVIFTHPDPGSRFVIQFVEIDAEGEPQAIEHSRLAWVTLNELQSVELAPSDRKFASHLLELAAGSEIELG